MTNLKCIIGLGNPGRSYAGTRHNIGFWIADALELRCKSSFKPGYGAYWQARCSFDNIDLLVVKPTTYMNESGQAFMEVMERETLSPSDILVIVDDFQIPLGTLRFRERGSDGGHNGIASIIYHLQSEHFHRLRVGIGGEALPQERTETQMADYVLSKFTIAEQKTLTTILPHAIDAVLAWATHGIRYAMNGYNRSFLAENIQI